MQALKTPKPKSRASKRLLKIPKTEIMPLFVLGTGIFQILILLLLLIEGVWLQRLSRKPPPSLVQLVDGRVVRVTAIENFDRTPATIKHFVGETMALMFNWSGTLPPASDSGQKNVPQPDPGVPIKTDAIGSGGDKVTTPSWEASFALSENFRVEFLKKIATLTPRSVFSGGTQVMLVVTHLSEPQQLKPGEWKVKMVANLLTFDQGDNTGKAIPFNKDVYVHSIDRANASNFQKEDIQRV
ncbi:MAG: hypothetical protein KME05_06435 [Gloeocapsa sp. UFS-A4-WI-NPMV-4B04]|jgi:hypothetical protein|nr:hypothetical protein [Gloeocapsa sp. UFS-A4-WI-NPMV-4B04]